MSMIRPEIASPRFFVGVAAADSGPQYTVTLAIADQPVKPSRKPLRQVSAVVLRNGQPIADAEVSVGFHPLQAPEHRSRVEPGELLLAHDHHPYARPEELHGSLALHDGAYYVDVTINQKARAAFMMEM